MKYYFHYLLMRKLKFREVNKTTTPLQAAPSEDPGLPFIEPYSFGGESCALFVTLHLFYFGDSHQKDNP